MKYRLFARALLLMAALPPQAGAGEDKTLTMVRGQPLAESWQFNLGLPSWLAGVQGEAGVRDKTAGVNVSAVKILRHLNFTSSFCAEARKGPFGFSTDFLYLDDRAGVATNGLVSSMALRVDEYLADAEVSWRFIERPWGWAELRAGCRYTNLYDQLGLSPESGAIQKASVALTDAAAGAVGTLLEEDLRGVLDGKSPVLPMPPLGAEQKQKLVEAITNAKADPELAAALQSGVQARIDQAKRNVGKKIARILERGLSRAFSLGQDWFDPYLGLAARYDFHPPFYVIAKADAGGAGMGSRFTWQGYGGLGCQLSRQIYAEAGYRYLFVDYRSGGFVYDTATRGAQITVGIVF